uniref:Uncharacterized protein n=1 Tax=Panagrolaimus superbus TaxID=310955 RepID=A0A914YRD1_9BILA
MYAANIIAYIAKWNEEYIPDIIEADAIPSFIQIFKCDRQVSWNLMTEKDAAVYGLVQICRKENYRDLCIQQGIIKPLISFINSIANIKFLPDSYSNNVSALIVCLCRPYNAQTSSENAQLLLPELNKLSQNLNNGVILNAIILIREFLEGGPKYTELLIDFELMQFFWISFPLKWNIFNI